VLVKVEGVSKKFCRSLKRSLWYGVKDMAHELNPLGGRTINESQIIDNSGALRDGEFWAVNDVSFELRRGECLGLIGRNGAGKTTLLKMLNGLIKPDRGRIEIRGQVGALIALGAAFNPILTGRENIYVNGSVLGLTRQEIDAKMEDIIDFADIREFIDSPVQSYSSGMQVRLGFAVATALDPDVLILDEILAVGDASFRHKCYHRINKLIKNSAVILVSHSMEYIATLSTSVGMMQRGDFQRFADVGQGIAAYDEANKNTTESDDENVFAFYPPVVSARVQIVDPLVYYGESLNIKVDLRCSESIRNAVIGFSAVNQNEQYAMSCSSSRLEREIEFPVGLSVLKFKIDPLLLHDGDYRWNFSISRQGSIEHLVWAMRAGKFTVRSPHKAAGNTPYLPRLDSLEVLS